MKAYQDHDPVADKGKAEPQPKAPNPTRMVSRFGSTLSPHPLIEKPYRFKPSRAARARATAERKAAMRKLVKSMQ